jgi:hypothetical protein
LCDARQDAEFWTAFESLLTVLTVWLFMCAAISMFGAHWIMGLLHASSGMACFVQRRRIVQGT